MKYDASKRNDWGRLNDHILINTDDSIEPKKIVMFNVEIVEDFTYLKNDSPLPIFFVKQNEYNFGQQKPGDKV